MDVKPDLEINNYNLNDILNLFHLRENFNEADMKRAKRQVLKLHPDKSRLDPSYFLFYSKAYKILHQVYEFNNRTTKKSDGVNTDEYVPLETSQEDKNVALSSFFDKNKKLKKVNNFNDWFNKEFEKQKMENDAEKTGYGDWLTSDDDVMEQTEIGNVSAMAEQIAKRKQEVRSMVVHQGINDMESGGPSASSLGGGALENYSSGMFSSVQFQDLKQAHVESVIPVTDEDYANVKKFRNVNEYNTYRHNQDTTPLSEQQALQYLASRDKQEESLSTQRAFDLAKQTEEANERNTQFWAGIMKIEDKKK